MFTLDELRTLANAASFSRGRAYFEQGAVGRVRYRPDDQLYSATVSGSEDYDVELTLDEDGPDFWCSCPYDYDGICKHGVALGLAVLEQFGPEAEKARQAQKKGRKTTKKADSGPAQTNFATERPVSALELEAAIKEVSSADKVKFLTLRLRQDDALARLFLTHFYGAPLPPDPLDADATLPRPDAVRDELRRALTRLRFDYDAVRDDDGNMPAVTYGYGNTSRHLPALAQRIRNILAPVLAPEAEAVRAALAAGRLAEALRRWQGAWLAIESLKTPAVDKYQLFVGGYYGPLVAEAWLRQLRENGTTELLEKQEFASEEATRSVPGLIRPLEEALRPRPARAGQAHQPPLPPVGQELLLAAAPNPALAPLLRPALAPYQPQLAPLLRLRLAAGCHDWAVWEPLAAQLAATDANVAVQLLRFYLDQQRLPELVTAAFTYLTRYPAVVGPFVLAHLSPSDNRLLYVRALAHRLEADQELADYETLTGLWTPAEKDTFLKQLFAQKTPKFKPLFRVRVLLAENRAAEVLPLLLTLDWYPRPRQSWWVAPAAETTDALPELLQLAARPDPEALLDAVMERSEEYIDDTGRRGVALYEAVAGWLKVLHELPALTEQVQLFAEGLNTKYKRLAHLRRALREARLLPEPEPRPVAPPRASADRPGRKPRNPFGK